VLLQAQQVGLMGSEHNFIIASLVRNTINGKIISLTILYVINTPSSFVTRCAYDEWTSIVFLGHAHLGLERVQVQRDQHHRDEVGEAARRRVPEHRVAVDGQPEPARTRRQNGVARDYSGSNMVATYIYIPIFIIHTRILRQKPTHARVKRSILLPGLCRTRTSEIWYIVGMGDELYTSYIV